MACRLRPARPGVPREAVETVEEQGPALLKEGEEGIPIRHDGLEGPRVEGSASPEHSNQAVIQEARQPLSPVVSPQQDAQQIDRAPDERGRDVEDVQQREVLGRVVPEPVRSVPHPRAVERIEMAAVERGDDRMAEAGKQLAQPEGKLSAGLQKVVGKGCKIALSGPQDDDRIGGLAPSRPDRNRDS